MPAYRTVAQVLENFTATSGRHRHARVLRFIHRHRDSHQHITGQLRRAQQRHMRRMAKRAARA